MTEKRELDRLRHEVVVLNRALVDHPAAQALRFLSPFVRDALAAGVWEVGMGTDSVEHEMRAALAWLDTAERKAAPERGEVEPQLALEVA